MASLRRWIMWRFRQRAGLIERLSNKDRLNEDHQCLHNRLFPGAELRNSEDRNRRRHLWPRRWDTEWARACRRQLSYRARYPMPYRAGSFSDRGYLAISV